MGKWKYNSEKRQNCGQQWGEEHWKGVKQCQWKVVLSNPTEKMPVHKSENVRNVISRNTSSKIQEIRLQKNWRNWRKGVAGAQWPSVWMNFFSTWQNWSPIHCRIQFCWAFDGSNFFYLRNWPWKLKYHFLGGSFTRLTSQSQTGTLSRYSRS